MVRIQPKQKLLDMCSDLLTILIQQDFQLSTERPIRLYLYVLGLCSDVELTMHITVAGTVCAISPLRHIHWRLLLPLSDTWVQGQASILDRQGGREVVGRQAGVNWVQPCSHMIHHCASVSFYSILRISCLSPWRAPLQSSFSLETQCW